MKILHINWSGNFGGEGTSVWVLPKANGRIICEADVLCLKRRVGAEAGKNGRRVEELSMRKDS